MEKSNNYYIVSDAVKAKLNSYYIVSKKEYVQCELIDIDECVKYYNNTDVDKHPPVGFGIYVLARSKSDHIDAKFIFSENEFLMRNGDTIIASFKASSVEEAIMLWMGNKRLVEPEAAIRSEGYHEQ